MNISEQAIAVIDSIAAKLGVAAEYVYPLMIKQAYVDGAISIAQVIVSLFIITVFVLAIKYYLMPLNDDGDTRFELQSDIDLLFVILILLGFASFFSLFFLCFGFSDAIKALVNPEWYAINKLLKLVK